MVVLMICFFSKSSYNYCPKDMGAGKGILYFKTSAQCGYKLHCAPLHVIYITPQIDCVLYTSQPRSTAYYIHYALDQLHMIFITPQINCILYALHLRSTAILYTLYPRSTAIVYTLYPKSTATDT